MFRMKFCAVVGAVRWEGDIREGPVFKHIKIPVKYDLYLVNKKELDKLQQNM